MDPQRIAQVSQSIEAARLEIESSSRLVSTLTVVMIVLMAVYIILMVVSMVLREQYYRAERRMRDRMEQEEDPEGWAWRQDRKAREAALIAEELAAMRRASWYGRLLDRVRQQLARGA